MALGPRAAAPLSLGGDFPHGAVWPPEEAESTPEMARARALRAAPPA